MKNPIKHMKISLSIFVIFLIAYFVGREYFSNHPEIELETSFTVAYIIVTGLWFSFSWFIMSIRTKINLKQFQNYE